jgi:peptide-methionine (R)-S-oxide reductase
MKNTPYPIQKTDAQWQAELGPVAYQVTRQAATERAFTGEYWNYFAPGQYCCIACKAALFEAETKFDAGCGWPSYWAAISPEAVERVSDTSHGMARVEVRCQQCGSHLGHVFPDGPAPTGERFCINSAAIKHEAI